METGLDIFATKGIEYLLVLFYLASLLLYWFVLSGKRRVAPPTEARPYPLRAGIGIELFQLRPELAYHPGHAWVDRLEDNRIRVGIDDFAGRLLDPPTDLNLPEVGSYLQQGEAGWSLNVAGENISIANPVEGRVVAVNEALNDRPELVSESPYDHGWILELDIHETKETDKGLLTGTLAQAWKKGTVDRLLAALGPNLGPVHADGGLLLGGLARQIARESWPDLAAKFLQPGSDDNGPP